LSKTDIALAIINDIATLNGLPIPATVTSVAAEGLQKLYARRTEIAKQALLAKLRSGEKESLEVASEDAVWASVDAFYRAAIEGAARESLGLLAASMSKTVFSAHLTADEFLYFAPIFASLRPNEIDLLAAFLKAYDEVGPHDPNNEEEERASEFILVKEWMVPSAYPDGASLLAACAALFRTGLLLTTSTWGGVRFETSPLLLRARELTGADGFKFGKFD